MGRREGKFGLVWAAGKKREREKEKLGWAGLKGLGKQKRVCYFFEKIQTLSI